MKEQIITTGIVLARTDFQEADRILTLLTPDHGKLRAIAKGVRRPRSKLAGGIELLSVSNFTYLPGRGDLGTLISTRLITHFGNIVQDIQRTMLAYEFLKRVNRITEDAAGGEYFALLERALAGLHELDLPGDLAELWFNMQLLHVTGHLPNLQTDTTGKQLSADGEYLFDFDAMTFSPQPGGPFHANHIKLLRLAYATESPGPLKLVTDTDNILPEVLKLAKNMLQLNVRV